MSTPAQVSRVPLFARLEEAGRQVNVKAHVEIVGIAERLARIEQAVTGARGPAGGTRADGA